MREINFRAYFHNKATKEKRMINWEEFSSYNGCGVILKDGGEFYHVMQSTGLKDKNGVEIYEGDILHIDYQPDPYFTGIKMDGYVKQKDNGEWIFYKDEKNLFIFSNVLSSNFVWM